MDSNLYDSDFYAWAMKNADLIRQGKLSDIDAEHVAEELEAMSGSQRRELLNRLTVLITHLLKWQYQPGCRGRSWSSTIYHQRRQIELLIEESPSLRRLIQQILEKAYGYARRDASDETGIAPGVFPETCPYSFEQVMDNDFWPDAKP